MKKELEKLKNERINEIKEYAKEHTKAKYDKDGNKTEYVDSNPVVISERFFKRIQKPKKGVFLYTSEELEEFYELYRELVTAVNEYTGIFPTSLATFCKLIGVTIDTLKQYRETNDEEMKLVIDMIFDEIGDDNLFFAQLGHASEKSTLFKLKSQNEMTEKKTPNLNVSIKALVNTAKYDKNIEKYEKLLGE